MEMRLGGSLVFRVLHGGSHSCKHARLISRSSRTKRDYQGALAREGASAFSLTVWKKGEKCQRCLSPLICFSGLSQRRSKAEP